MEEDEYSTKGIGSRRDTLGKNFRKKGISSINSEKKQREREEGKKKGPSLKLPSY